MTNQRGRLVSGAAIVSLMLALGCASAPREVELPPQSLTEAPTSTVEQEAALVSPARADEASATDAAAEESAAAPDDPAEPMPDGRRQTIVIQSGTASEVTPRTLQQATQTERDRRAASDAPLVVITNNNLAELAEGGQLTIVGAPEPGTTAASTAPASAPATAETGSAGEATAPAAAAIGAAAEPVKEEYWRGQALKLRLDWKAAVETVDELESEVQELRRRFYEEDDPFYRDNQIKPAWDRTLDLLAAAKTNAEEQERRVSRFLEDGRRAGALPGWLREGAEFEPPPTADPTPAGHRRTDDPWEPKILHEDATDP
jgi:hypothetical protein